MKKHGIILCVFVAGYNIAQAADYYVKSKATAAAGTVSGNGSSWTNAILDDPGTGGSELKTLIESAGEGDIIYIAAGTYTFEDGENKTEATASIQYFPLKKGVKIYGGYPANSTGTNTSENLRNHTATVLSGFYSTSIKVRHVVYNNGDPDISGALYDGLVVQDGGSANAIYGTLGGGVFLENITAAGTEPVLNNVTIRNCKSHCGGGLALKNPVNTDLNTVPVIKITNLTVENCEGNTAEVYSYGGGVYISRANARFKNLTLKNNKCYWGGGLAVGDRDATYSGIAEMENVTLTGNSSQSSGGGICVKFSTIKSMMKNIRATDNRAMYGHGGGIYLYHSVLHGLDSLTLTKNRAYNGGGMYIESPINDNNRVIDIDTVQNIVAKGNNADTGFGGGVAIIYSDINVMKNITVEYNYTGTGNPPYQLGGSEWDGTGNPSLSLTTGGAGGGLYMDLTHVNTTIYNIKASKNTSNAAGGGIYIAASVTGIDSLVVESNIARHSGGGLYVSGDITPTSRLSETSLVIDNRIHVTNNYTGVNGGGIYLSAMKEMTASVREKGPVLRNVTLEGNKANDNGGGIYLTSIDDGLVENTIIRNNTAGYMRACNSAVGHGGGAYNTTFNGTYRGVNIDNNQAHACGGGMYNTTAVMFISDFCVNHNRATSGGGMYNTTFFGNLDQALLTVARGQVNNNIAHGGSNILVSVENRGNGGGMVNTTGNYALKNVEVVGNYAQNDGGGIFNTTSHWQKFYNMLIADNYSGGVGGGIYNTTCHNVQSILGSYAVGDGTPPTYTNITVTGNYAAGVYASDVTGNASGNISGGGIANVNVTKLILNNSILYNNKGCTNIISPSPVPGYPVMSDIGIRETDIHTNGSRDTKAFNTIIGAAEFKNLLDARPGRLEISHPEWYAAVNPLFMNMPDPVRLKDLAFTAGTGATCQEQNASGTIIHPEWTQRGNYRLQQNSPCIDAGNNSIVQLLPVTEDSLDFDKESRFQNGIIDLGAYEGFGGENYDYPCFGCAALPPDPPIVVVESFFRWWYISSPYKNANPRTFDLPAGTLGSAAGSMLGYYSEPDKRYTEPFVTYDDASDKKHKYFPANEYFTPGQGIAVSLDTAITSFNPPNSLTFADVQGIYGEHYGSMENDPVVHINIYKTDNVSGQSSKKGINLLGNPYLSNLDLYRFYEENDASIEPTVWIRGWNRNANEMMYDTYNILADEGTDDIIPGKEIDRVIPPVQAFWVRSLKDMATVVFKRPKHLADDQSHRLLRLPAASDNRTVRLTVTSGNISNNALIVFSPRAKNGYDAYDSEKISNGMPNIPELYTLIDGREIAINGIPPLQGEIREIPLGFRTGKSGSFTISGKSGNRNGIRVVLRDNKSGTETELSADKTHTFHSDVYNSTKRFTLKINAIAAATENTECSTQIYVNDQNRITVQTDAFGTQCTVRNTLGQRLAEETIAAGIHTLKCRLDAGVYIVKAGSISEKVIIK